MAGCYTECAAVLSADFIGIQCHKNLYVCAYWRTMQVPAGCIIVIDIETETK